MHHYPDLQFESYCSYLLHRLDKQAVGEVYLYGTGMYAKKIIAFFSETAIRITGLIDDNFGDIHYNNFTIPIFRTTDIKNISKTIIIASKEYQEIIFQRLTAMQMPETQIIKVFEKADCRKTECLPFHLTLTQPKIDDRIKTILYVGDNTDTPNLGCRATSQALADIIAESVLVSDKLRRNDILNLFAAIPLCDDLFHYASAVKQLNKTVWDELALRIKKVDAVVLNGEGSFIFQSPPRLDLHNYATLLLICAEVGKPFFVLNAMFSTFSDEPLNVELMEKCLSVLELARIVTARDSYSMELIARHNKKINVKYVPDALFSWYPIYKENSSDFKQILRKSKWIMPFGESTEFEYEIDFNSNYILMSGNSYAAHYPQQALKCFTELAVALYNLAENYNMKLYFIECCRGDRILRNVATQTGFPVIPVIPVEINIYLAGYILGNAACFISGRYHPLILASLGGTPCVFMSGNSHKTASLQEVLKIPANKQRTFRALPDKEEIKKITEIAERMLSSGRCEKIQQTCAQNARLAIKLKNLFGDEKI